VLRGQAESVLSRLDPQGIRPTVAIAAFLLAFFFGSQILNSVIPARGSVPLPNPGGPQPTPIGPGPTSQPGGVGTIIMGPLTVQVPAGWQAFEGPVGPRIAKGSVAIDIQTTGFSGDASALYRSFVDQVLRPNASGLTATEPTLVSIGGGLPAVRGLYTGIFGQDGQVEGHVTALVVGGQGFIFDAWGPVGTVRPLLNEIELITNTLVVN
jgi:hypothetical protein